MKIKHNHRQIKRQITNKKWRHTREVVNFANDSLPQTLEKLKIPDVGLTDKFILKRNFGQLYKKEPRDRFRFVYFFFQNFKDPFTLILLLISIYNFIMYGLNSDITYIVGGVVVVFLVAFSVIVDLIAKYAMYKDNKKIKKTNRETIKVLRNIKTGNDLNIFKTRHHSLINQLKELDYHDLEVGDLIYLKDGDVVPADAKIIYDYDGVAVEEEILIGSKNAAPKKSFNTSLNPNIFLLSNIIYRGSKLVHGSCWALVLYKGRDTYYEHLKRTSVDKKEKTTFNLQTRKVSRFLITCISTFAPLIFLLALILTGLRNGFNDEEVWIQSIIFGMTIVICLAPDSLPLSMTSAFARTRKKLAAKNIISRDIGAAQNIGSMDVLAVDMRRTFVNSEYTFNSFVNLNNQSSQEVIKWAALSYLSSPSQNPELLQTLMKEKRITRLTKSLQSEYEVIRQVNFHGAPRTYISVVEDADHQRWAIIRGPKSLILANSSTYLNRFGLPRRIDKETLNPTIRNTFNEVNNQGFWSIGVAIKKIHDRASNNENEVLKNNYLYVGLINFVQTTISGASENLKELERQNVAIKYMAHEPLDQTLVLAKELGFHVTGYLSAKQINAMNDRKLRRNLEHVNVFYDLDSLSEIRLIKNLKKDGHTVGYMGKDLDDSMQILNAHIGITTHTSDVFGKQNANLIINEGTISDISEAIKQGRQASINIVKFIKVRAVWAIAITFKLVIGLILFNAQPMNSMELLTQNLIFDIVEFLLIFDRVDAHYIKKPVVWDTKSILPFALWNGLILQIITAINVCIFIFVIHPGILNDIRSSQPNWETQLALIQTIYWVEDTITHFLFILVMRTHYNKWFADQTSPTLLTAIIGCGIFTIAVPFVPWLNEAFAVKAPIWEWWVIFIALMAGYCLLTDLWKRIYVRKFHKWL